MLLEDGVFQHLGRPQTDDGLGLDLDRFAGLGIAAHARFAMCLYNAADAWDDELARAALGFFHRELVQLVEESHNGLLGRAHFFCDVGHDLGLAQWLGCHLVCLSS
jgi:hypothetical protein